MKLRVITAEVRESKDYTRKINGKSKGSRTLRAFWKNEAVRYQRRLSKLETRI